MYTIVCTGASAHDSSALAAWCPNASRLVSNSASPSAVRKATTCENASTIAMSVATSLKRPEIRFTEPGPS